MPALMLERRISEAIADNDGYREELLAIIANLGTLHGSTESAMVDLLANARSEVIDQLGAMAVDAPSRAVYERTLAGIDSTLDKMKTEMGTTLTKAQADAFTIGENLAIKPAVSRGVELVSAGISLDQLAILASYRADLIQGITGEVRKKINLELTSVMIGAKSPFSAAKAIGKNLTDKNHFSTLAHRARAIVVTEVGRAQALGTQAAQAQLQAAIDAEGENVTVRKRWINAHLPGARQTHLEAEATYHPDGSKGPIPVDQLYEIGGFKALYPKDPSLPASESVNCHCISITVMAEPSQINLGGTPVPPVPPVPPPEAPQPPPTPKPKPKPPVSTPEDVAAVQGTYSAAKAKAAAGAVKKTTKAKSTKAAQFLSDPYGAAGLEPLKPLPDGSNGYGGLFMGQKLGYGKPENGPFTFKGSVWYHNAAPAGKQLPDFKKLDVDEQLSLMTNAKLTKSQKRSVFQSVGKSPLEYEPKLMSANGSKFLDNPYKSLQLANGKITKAKLAEVFGEEALEPMTEVPFNASVGPLWKVKGAPAGAQLPTLRKLYLEWPGGEELIDSLMGKAKVAKADRATILKLLDDPDIGKIDNPLTKPYAVKAPPVVPKAKPLNPYGADPGRPTTPKRPPNDEQIIAAIKKGEHPPDDWDRRRSTYVSEHEAQLNAEYQANPLSGGKRTSVTGYSNGDYSPINSALRANQGDLRAISSTLKTKITNIKEAIAQYGPRDDWQLTWRVSRAPTQGRQAFVDEALEKAANGENLTLHGFVSSSVRTTVWGGIPAAGSGSLVFEILTKRGVWVQPITRHSGEYEWLIDEATEYEVLGWREITHDGQKYPVLQLREVI